MSWFVKIALVLTVFSLVVFDAVSVGVAKMNVQDTAESAAMVGADAYAETKDVRQAYAAANHYAEEHGATLVRKKFKVETNGTVRVTVEKDATTLLVFRVKRTRPWAHVVGSGARRSV